MTESPFVIVVAFTRLYTIIMPRVPNATHSRHIRQVFRYTWKEYYTWSPPSTRPLADARLVGSNDNPAHTLFDSLLDAAQVEPSTLHPPKHKSTSISTTSTPLPPYTFCSFLTRNIHTSDEPRCAFLPSLPNGDSLDESAYLTMFNYLTTAANYGQDTACDVIIYETRSRLHALGFTDKQIDASRILPMECGHIDSLPLERDMPPFPEEPFKILGMLVGDVADRIWEPPPFLPPEFDQSTVEVDAVEKLCRFADCFQYGCPKHRQSRPDAS